jgi:p24 family protein delta-1
MQIKDSVGNDYGRPKDVAGEQRMAFTSLEDAAFDVCFENTLTGRGMTSRLDSSGFDIDMHRLQQPLPPR